MVGGEKEKEERRKKKIEIDLGLREQRKKEKNNEDGKKKEIYYSIWSNLKYTLECSVFHHFRQTLFPHILFLLSLHYTLYSIIIFT